MDARDIVWLILIGLFFLIRYIVNESGREKRVERAADEDVARAKYGVLKPDVVEQLEKTQCSACYEIMKKRIQRDLLDPYVLWTGDRNELPYKFHWMHYLYDPQAFEIHMLQLFQPPRNLYYVGQLVFVMECECYRESLTALGKRFVDLMLEYLPDDPEIAPPDWRTKYRLKFENDECRQRLVMMADRIGACSLDITEDDLIRSIADEDPKRAERVRKQMAKDKLKAEKKKAKKN